MLRHFTLALLVVLPSHRAFAMLTRGSDTTTAIIGVTVIDGASPDPRQDQTVLIVGRRIAQVGPRTKVHVPAGARVINGIGRFVLPGFVDVNVHLTPYGTDLSWHTDTLDGSRVLELTRNVLDYGVTTVRDSYGLMPQLRVARDSINRGGFLGARLLFAGNIVGWGGPYSISFSVYGGHPPRFVVDSSGVSPASKAQKLEAVIQAFIQDTGEDLVEISTDSLRIRINQYLDKGTDFIKYGATTHGSEEARPNFMIFSDRAQRTIVEEAHKRGRIVDTHATSPEGVRTALLAGVDLVQHPEVLSGELSDELLQLYVRREVFCALTPVSALEIASRRTKAAQLIRAGCRIAVSTDSKTSGKLMLDAIEALVTLGMTPRNAIVAATANGAKACNMFDQFGTVERGKLADLVVLRDDPLHDIGAIRHIEMVFKEGREVPAVRPNRSSELSSELK